MSIEVRNISKKFGGFAVINDVSFTAGTGELLALLGPSGSGKTTLLRVIAGLETADAGAVLFHGEDATDAGVRERRVGFVFQHYALFRHMTVFENVAFGLKVRPRKVRPAKAEIAEKVGQLLRLVQLERFAGHFPSQLSGGQRQRVALARALAVEPKVLLLDEPFGALDAKVRRDLRQWLRRLHDELHITSVFVTHDQEEALEVADRVVVMNNGGIEQEGTPDEIYHRPASPFMYEFLGNVNLFHGRVEDGNLHVGALALPVPPDASAGWRNACAYIRPHQFGLSRQRKGSNQFRARVESINQAGPVARLMLVTEWASTLNVEVPNAEFLALALARGEDVFVEPRELKVFPSGGTGGA
ncbi:MAG: sulfate/molybdate ABC transporter ATP-binding protein [Nitrospinae bacterium]|nr:sulfate/molybdate ABC transporter ATP-binding protein [Nitrospinota bacterium]